MGSRAELVRAGQRALDAGDWEAARSTFRDALDAAESADALVGLSEALWWLGEISAAIEHGERAYAAYRRRGDMGRAARLALWLALRYDSNLGNGAVAAGWLARARGLVDEHDLEELRGWVLVHEAEATDAAAGETLAREAYELARRHGDVDLELCALSELGAKVVQQRRVEEGLGYLDEAMAGSLAGEYEGPTTMVFASCTTLRSCTSCGAYERVLQWIRVVDRFTARYGSPFLLGRCRTIYGMVLFALGEWVQAEEELTLATQASRDALPAVHTAALGQLAELRLAQGRLEEAERLVQGLEDHRATLPAVAMIRLERGHPASAEALLQRWIAPVHSAPLDDLLPHELLGEAELVQGRVVEAAERGEALALAGERVGCGIAAARGRRLQGRALASSDPDAARGHLDRALIGFAELGMPLEVARTRVHLAGVRAGHVAEVAVDELRRALEIFKGLGATRDADRTAGRLRDLGVSAARRGATHQAPLSPREREVLALVGEGLSNPEIADRLYISRRTVEHHVASVLAKLGLRNRGEAIAEAVRHLDVTG